MRLIPEIKHSAPKNFRLRLRMKDAGEILSLLRHPYSSFYQLIGPMTELIRDSTGLLCHDLNPRNYPGVRQRCSYHRHPCFPSILSPDVRMNRPVGPDFLSGNLNSDHDFQIHDRSHHLRSPANRSFDCPDCYSPYRVPLVYKFCLTCIGSGTTSSYKHRAVN